MSIRIPRDQDNSPICRGQVLFPVKLGEKRRMKNQLNQNYSSSATNLPPPPPMAMYLLLFCLLSAVARLTPHVSAVSRYTIVAELSALQAESETGVIRPTDALLRGIVSLPTPRPFHFVIFFDAKKLHSKPELSLPTLKSEFSIVSSSFISNNPDKKTLIFFFDIEFEESQASFALFGVNTLPHILLIPPSATDPKTDPIKMDAASYSRLADYMAEFVESQTKLSVGPITRPPIISKKQITIFTVIVLIWTPFIVKRLLQGNTIFHDKTVWMVGAILVYFFSVSGVMFNIIRKMPMFFVDRQNPEKIVFFYQGPGIQLGAEGFTVGFLYTVVGLLVAFVVHVLVRVKDVKKQRLVMVTALFVSFWAVKTVVVLDNWKTGYGIHMYWPNSWK